MLYMNIKSTILLLLIFTLGSAETFAQEDLRKLRIAKIEVYPADLEA